MGHGHGHGVSPEQAVSAGGRHLRRLWIAVGLGLVTFVLQVSVGLVTSSLALLADSAHVFTDVFGVALAAVAIVVARRSKAGQGRTFGLYRSEVLAALANAVLLFAVAGWVLYEAVGRFGAPPEVPGLPVTVVATVGLLMNVIAFLLLRDGAKESLNVRGAYLEVMADMIGSVGVLVSGVVTLAFGWRYADPVIGIGIGLFVLPRAYRLGRSALRILFQHAPEGVDVKQMTADLSRLPGVAEVHDLHVWTLTSGMEVVSAHLTMVDGADQSDILVAAQGLLADNYAIEHATLQVEQPSVKCRELSW
ncbi:cation diffusion facilitator family transporter [Kibdelosporangium phytohabitans]|uniref:Cation transporter n=1 Tax=Kibdelosporangium phytohabitans TaxID=860235 RepID=A0A0N9I3L0_9PSEU|nr:cation diffusion facilitator family transporter [Kibdelosporangium phytohabitans]ALG13338.1 cation transporter [Kibdelosporangium phytohabitans]MBE1465121.1 cobalt-zinc-cadmium efflux system protein [Kibdelosporangium phytohabitans]